MTGDKIHWVINSLAEQYIICQNQARNADFMYFYPNSDLMYITACCYMAYLVLYSDVILTQFIDFCMRNTATFLFQD